MTDSEEKVYAAAYSSTALLEVFVSVKNYIDYKTSTSSSSSRIAGRTVKNNRNKNITSLANRFKRLVFTPLRSRIMLPYFGSRVYELVDENMGFVWKVKLKKYLYECFFDENLALWDSDFDPLEIKVLDADAELGTVDVSLKFKNGMEINYNV